MTNVKTYALNSASSKQFDSISWEVLPMAAAKPATRDHLFQGSHLVGEINKSISNLNVPKSGKFAGHTYHVVITKARLSRTPRSATVKDGVVVGSTRLREEQLVMSRTSWTTLVSYLKEATPSADARLIAFCLRYGRMPKSYVLTWYKGNCEMPDFYRFLTELRRWIITGAVQHNGSVSAHFNDNVKVYVNLATNAICYIELR